MLLTAMYKTCELGYGAATKQPSSKSMDYRNLKVEKERKNERILSCCDSFTHHIFTDYNTVIIITAQNTELYPGSQGG